jgi:hypothetical protein
MNFEVVCLEFSRSAHTIGQAIKSATNDFINSGHAGDGDWMLMQGILAILYRLRMA